MASCNVNALLANGKCFASLPLFIVQVDEVDEWCGISQGGGGGIPSWWNPDVGAPIFNPDTGGVVVNPDL